MREQKPTQRKAEQVTHASFQRLDHKFVMVKFGILQAKLTSSKHRIWTNSSWRPT